MAVHKYQSVETEYGISFPDSRKTERIWDDCSELITAYTIKYSRGTRKTGWGMESELASAGRELYEPDRERVFRSGLFTNTVLSNGARYYVDHAHPEYSAPELSNARDVVVWEKAGDRILEASIDALRNIRGRNALIYKNNSDGKGHSYACHENYLVDRRVPLSVLAQQLIPFFVTRQIYAGAGKVGSENGAPWADFQLSQRADFIEAQVGSETTHSRPIINTRDEPHADPRYYRRLHVIVGDSNMSEVSTYLRNGVTALMLSMIEDGYIDDDFRLADPVQAIKAVSRDLTGRRPIELADGSTISPIELQSEYLGMAKIYAEREGVDEVTANVLARFEQVLVKLEQDPMSLAGELDWVTKLNVLQQYQDRRGWSWGDQNMRQVDLKYHDVRRDKGLYYLLERRGKIGRIVTDAMIDHAIAHPPEDTRAYFRGESVRRYAGSLAVAGWDYMLFDAGDGGPMRRVLLPSPQTGTKAAVGSLLDRSPNVSQLLANMTA